MDYLLRNLDEVGGLLWQHLQITLSSVAIALIFAFPLAWLITSVRWLSVPVLGLLGIFYTIPSLALIILLVPLLGLTARSVIAAMVVYTQLILVRNIAVGINNLDGSILEAARGMGMNPWQCWWRVQFPLGLPIFLAGIRLATIITIAIAAIGARFGAGGLGVLLFEGVQQNRSDKIWAGTIMLTLLALACNGLLLYGERRARK